MQLKGIGNWVKEKLKAMRSKSKEHGAPQAPITKQVPFTPTRRPIRPRFSMRRVWEQNALHPTAYTIQRGRTLNPVAVAKAHKWRRERVTELTGKIASRTASIKEIKELIRLTAD